MADEDDPWVWGVGGIFRPDPAPEVEIPALTAVASLLLVSRIHQHMKPPKKSRVPNKKFQERTHDRSKYERVARLVQVRLEETREAVANMPEEGQINVPNSPLALRELIHKRLPELLCLNLLISAWATNPLTPYDIQVGDKVRSKAMTDFAEDLGVPKQWADKTRETVESATRIQEPNRVVGIGLAIVGLGAVVAAAPLVIAAAPATLSGGAVIMAGLAALGPGGMMGGLAIVTTLAGVGGGTAAAGAFVTGSPKQVAENVIVLHATALAKASIRPGTPPRKEVRLLVEMEAQLERQERRHEDMDDKPSKTLFAIKKKRLSVEKALKDLGERDDFKRIFEEIRERGTASEGL